MMITVIGIKSHQVTDGLWEKVEPYVQEGCDAWGTEDADDVLKWIKEKIVQLWLVVEREGEATNLIGSLITEIVNYPKADVLRFRNYGGRMNTEVVDAISALVKPWAVAQGCNRAEVWGRPGWQKLGGRMLGDVRRSAVLLVGDL